MNSELNFPNPFEIIVGTYEQYVLGYKVHNIVNEYKIEKSFATASHVASVRSVASNKHYLASAGADETVCLYDMRYRIESGKLVHHKDTINCIEFTPEGSHLFTCSDDGSITAVRCGNWQMEKLWQLAHKGSAVNTLAIHPTGKLALSTGRDGVLRTWNLIKGRQAYATNLIPKLKSDAKWINIIKWNPSGEKYLLAINKNIYIYSVVTAAIDTELVLNAKIICVEFLKDNLIAVGLENGEIKFYDLRISIYTVIRKAHDMRVKCIASMNDLLISASSSGEIKLWKYNEHNLDILQTINCGARITCLSLAQAYKNLVKQEEIKLQGEKKIEKKNKFRLRQEVIIEHEGECDIIDSISFKEKASKIKQKKKRVIEDTEDNNCNLKKKTTKSKKIVSKKKGDSSSQVEDIIDKPKKKQKLKVSETNSKKRKESNTTSQISSPNKKIKKTENIKVSLLPRKEHKTKLSMRDVEDPLSKKRKVDTEKGFTSKKKKKKIME